MKHPPRYLAGSPTRKASASSAGCLGSAASVASRSNVPMGCSSSRLLEARVTVVPVHADALITTRSRYQVARQVGQLRRLRAGRTRTHRLTPAARGRAQLRRDKALRALTPHPPRARAGMLLPRQPAARRAGALWPEAAQIFTDIDLPIGLLSASAVPAHRMHAGSPPSACNPSSQGSVQRPAHTRRRGELLLEARRTVVLRLVAYFRPLVDGIQELDSKIAHHVRARPDGGIFLSLSRNPIRSPASPRLQQPARDPHHRPYLAACDPVRVTEHTPCDPTRHGALQRLLAQTG